MKFFSNALHKFYAAVALRHFGLALITLFIPAYLYRELHFSLAQILGFFLLQEFLTIAFIFFSVRFISRHGARTAMLASVPFFVAAYFFLPGVRDPAILLLTAVSRAIFASLYWISFHLFLARSASAGKFGAATGKTWFWLRTSAIAGPLIGGILLQYVGYAPLFAVMLIFQLASVAMLPSIEIREPFVPLQHVLSQVPWKRRLVWFSQGIGIDADVFLWSLFAFLAVQTYVSLGLLSFLADCAVAVFALWLGSKADSIKRPIMLTFAWLETSLSWLWRAFVSGPLSVLAGIVLGNVSFQSMETPIVSELYSEGIRQGDLLSRVAVREIVLRLAVLPVVLLGLFLPMPAVFLVVAIWFTAAGRWLVL